MDNLSGKKVIVVGAGVSGQSAVKILSSLGAKVILADQKNEEKLSDVIEKLKDLNIDFKFGLRDDSFFLDASLIVISPGIPIDTSFLVKARNRDISVIGETELAFRCQNLPVLAVTGSNGKTTTVSLTGHILEKNKVLAYVGGNIGNPFSDLALKFINNEKVLEEVSVLEISSFQLESIDQFKAKGAAFLNLSPDHLDRHGDMNEYIKQKFKIFNRQSSGDWAIVNDDDPFLSDQKFKAKRFSFSLKTRPDFGAWVNPKQNDVIVVVDGQKVLAEAPVSSFQLRGGHNYENIMAAVGLSMSYGISAENSLLAAMDFNPGDHRLQFVGSFKGVNYYDDSKGTNIGAVVRALESFDTPVLLIAGGRDKDLDFNLLREIVREKVRELILLGECKYKIKDALKGCTKITIAESMKEAVNIASNLANLGEIVLLSPACASFDMYNNYKERGDDFSNEVRSLMLNKNEN
jgi:UDP-N-acetylmuramoylalanine--D-glutamate ligase